MGMDALLTRHGKAGRVNTVKRVTNMNIDDLTVGQAKEIARYFSTNNAISTHPLIGRKVVAVLPHGFVHFGELDSVNGHLLLREASNLRYWSKRDGGVPEFAKKGPNEDDKIDPIGDVYIESILFFYPCGNWK